MHFGTKAAITFPLALLMLLALLTFWINRSVQPPAPRLDGSSRHDPDYIMSNFVTTQTDINGDLRYKLAAVEMRHFPDNDTTELQRPRYTQFAIGKPYTEVQGLRGFVSTDGEEIKLLDNVKVTRQAYAGKGEMTVETDYLNIRPNDELVTTDRPVVIRQAPKTVIYATGMIYEKKQHTVTLLHKVRAHYERPVMDKGAATSTQTDNAGKKTAAGKQEKNHNGENKPLNTGQKTLKQDKSNTNNVRIRRHYE
ncbi:LPS export ABC transporter periplasmic protein LptC [Methylotenera sp. G11]|uniref:LPS export ABC transporter periplasmic protein LptC n=1 Tax=Methylotenera sp. G11 TaxID=1506585 RepID=UPI0006480FCB|nr:LPS export ABC transporter periplasmic protein LptC [Methylotenera sp. G11]